MGITSFGSGCRREYITPGGGGGGGGCNDSTAGAEQSELTLHWMTKNLPPRKTNEMHPHPQVTVSCSFLKQVDVFCSALLDEDQEHEGMFLFLVI